MEYKDIKEADGFISGRADNWLISVTNYGPEKIASISFVKYVSKHSVVEDLLELGPVKTTMEVLATFSLNESAARELAGSLNKMLDEYVIPNK